MDRDIRRHDGSAPPDGFGDRNRESLRERGDTGELGRVVQARELAAVDLASQLDCVLG